MSIEPASLGMGLIRPLLFRMDAEDAHHLGLDVLSRVSALPRVLEALASCSIVKDESLRVRAMGLDFANPLGVAAGLDKGAVALPALAALGFGAIEAGTITPLPQEGNPRPRVFRLEEDGAVINRMGFPSEGASVVAARLDALSRKGKGRALLGINVGRNKATPNEAATDDYLAALAPLRAHADYVAVNVSSPNTPGLRSLQDPGSLRRLVEAVVGMASPAPVVVKLSPDLSPEDLDGAIDACLEAGARGLIVANTSLARPASLRCQETALEAGGLSGTPLLEGTVALVAHARRRAGGGVAIIGAGGIASADDAWRVLAAGADLVQIYTAFIYGGPALPARILRGLRDRLRREGRSSVTELRG